MVCATDSNVAFSRHAYTYPEATLPYLQHGDSIRQLEFYKFTGFTYAGNPNFKIYLSMSKSPDFGLGNIQSWSGEISQPGVVKVFDNRIGSIVDASIGYKSFVLDSIFVVDTTYGKNLRVFVQFDQSVMQPSSQIPLWAYENGTTVPEFVSFDETKYILGRSVVPDTTNASQIRKPTIRIFHQRTDTSAQVMKAYCLGELAMLMAPEDTIKFRVRNTGAKKLYNHGFEIKISGANSYIDTVYLDSLEPLDTRVLYTADYKPKKTGRDSMWIISLNDGFNGDDSLLFLRNITTNVLSHNNPYVPNSPLGIGFNQSTGDFVAKYYTDSNYINQIEIGFTSNGVAFALGIWDEDTNGAPGKELYMSDTLYTNGGQYIQTVLPKVKVTDGYFVGIRQHSGTNVGFRFEDEAPIRPGTFFFTAPAGGTTWTPFDPGFNFNFDIQPRIQVEHDVAVTRIVNPAQGDTLEFDINDSIKPQAVVTNFGFRDENIPFDVVCEGRNSDGVLIYTSTKVITLDADDSTVVTFDKPFSLGNYGNLSLRVYTKLPTDLAKENDTLESNFGIFVKYDIQIESFFSPIAGSRFEFNKDSLGTVVRVVNFGVVSQKNINVTARLRQGNQVARSQTKTIDLDAASSMILDFDSITIPFAGEVLVEVFCWNAIDSFSINDTLTQKITVVLSNDMGMLSIIRPIENSVYLRKDVFEPYINYRNFGVADQDSVVVTAKILNEDLQTIYTDTVPASVDKFSTIQALFEDFTCPDTAQTLYFSARVWINGDQNPSNDTIASTFFVKTARDAAVRQAISPRIDSIYEVNKAIGVTVNVENTGTNALPGDIPVMIRIFDDSNTEVYYDSLNTTAGIAVDGFEAMSFNSFTPSANGRYRAIFYIDYDQDGESANDTLMYFFEVKYERAIAVLNIIDPVADTVFQLNRDTLFPSFTISNNGLNDIKSITNYDVIVRDNNSAQIFGYSGVLDSLNVNNQIVIKPDTFFIAPTTGTYSMEARITNVDDGLTTDNSTTHPFRVTLANDVLPYRFVYPEQDSFLFVNYKQPPRAEFENIGDSDQNFAFSVSYIITRDNKTLFNSNKNLVLSSGEKKIVEFDSFTPTVPGQYNMMVITRLGQDQVKSNDTLTGTFEADYHVGINTLDINTFKVFPNPATDLVYVESDGGPIHTVEMIDAHGKALNVAVHTLNFDTVTVDVSEISSGQYWLRIQTDEGEAWKTIQVH